MRTPTFLLDDVMFNRLTIYIMNKTVLEIRELILSAIDYLKNYFLKKDLIEILAIEKQNLKHKDEKEIRSSIIIKTSLTVNDMLV